MPVKITDYLSTTDVTDTYPTHASEYGKGGWHEVADNTARDAIPAGRRTAGMAVYTTASGKLWILDADLTTWVEFSGGGAGSDAKYVHDQAIPSATWNITHSLGKYPSVTVVDSAGSVVEGEISYTDANSLVLTFVGGFAGKAYMN